MLHKDVATGTKQTTGQNYSSSGPASCFKKGEKLPESQPVKCSLWDLINTCTGNQRDAVKAGTALVHNFLVISPAF
jgi:carboxypeptidase D